MACWNTEIRTNGTVVVESGLRTGKYFGKFWVAKITGRDPKFGLKREFINSKEEAVLNGDGFYQVHRSTPYGAEEYFLQVTGTNSKVVGKEEVVSSFEAPTQEEIVDSINAEEAAEIAKLDAEIEKLEGKAAKFPGTGYNPWAAIAQKTREKKTAYIEIIKKVRTTK